MEFTQLIHQCLTFLGAFGDEKLPDDLEELLLLLGPAAECVDTLLEVITSLRLGITTLLLGIPALGVDDGKTTEAEDDSGQDQNANDDRPREVTIDLV